MPSSDSAKRPSAADNKNEVTDVVSGRIVQAHAIQAGVVHGHVYVHGSSANTDRRTTLNVLESAIDSTTTSAMKTQRRAGYLAVVLLGIGLGAGVNYATNLPSELAPLLAGGAAAALGAIVGSLFASYASQHQRVELEQVRRAVEMSDEERVAE